jgi:hypothetical protein
MTAPLEQLAKDLPEKGRGIFFFNEISEWPTDMSLEEVTLRLCNRQQGREHYEKDYLAFCYGWMVHAMEITVPGGLVSNTKPNPIPVTDLTEILRQLSFHPAYDKHYVVCIAEDWTCLAMHAGKTVTLGEKTVALVRVSKEGAVSRKKGPKTDLEREVEKAFE